MCVCVWAVFGGTGLEMPSQDNKIVNYETMWENGVGEELSPARVKQHVCWGVLECVCVLLLLAG